MIDEHTKFFLEGTIQPMAVVGVDGKIIEVNLKFLTFFSIKQGDNIKQVIDEESNATFEEVIEQSTLKNTPITSDFIIKMDDQQRSAVTTYVYFDDKKNVVILLFTLPVNKQENHGKDLLSEVNQVESLYLVSDQAGYIQEVNNLSEDFFELPKEYFVGRKIDFFLSLFSEDSEITAETKKKIIGNEDVQIIHKYIHSNKRIYYYKIERINPISSDGIILKVTDYTEKIAFQQELNQKESLLEVGQLAASVAHEIRNPVTTLKGFTQLLKRTADQNVMKYLAVFEDEIERIENVLSEMLTLSKPAKIERKPLSLRGLLENIICVIEPKAIMENIKIVQEDEYPGTPILHGDEGRLKQIFLNVLKNAIESMPLEGTLTIHLLDGGKNQVHVIIEDTGKGIEEANLRQIFMPYFTTRADGTGLGMPFVLQAVEEHDGTISVSSEMGVGTSFILTFPTVEPNGFMVQRLESEKMSK